MGYIIKSEALLDWLEGAGIPARMSRRVVIDATVGKAVVVYVEMYGTEELIKIEPPPELKMNVRVLDNGNT